MSSRPLRMRRGRSSPAERARLADLERALLDGGATGVGSLLPPLLDHLAGRDHYLFHGSNLTGLTELRAERESSDTHAFGRQKAVYATQDPHWAMFYALVHRANAHFISNMSIGARRTSRQRWYRRDVYVKDAEAPAVTSGWLYVVPRDTFRPQPRWRGLVDTAQWVSESPVVPLFCLPVSAAEYPPARFIRTISAAHG